MTPEDQDLRAVGEALEREDDESFARCLDQVLRRGSSAETAAGLLGLLRDEEDMHHQMFGLIHAIERLAPEHVYVAVASGLGQLWDRTQEWSEIVVARLLAARMHHGKGFDFGDFLRVFVAIGNERSRTAFASIVTTLGAVSNPSVELAEGVRAARAALSESS